MSHQSVRPICDIEERKDNSEDQMDEGIDEGIGTEIREQRKRRLPEEPTFEEVEAHNVYHVNYREWCPHGVRGKGISHPHRRIKERSQDGIPVVHIDYMFLSSKKEEGEERGMPTLAIKDGETGMMFARVVPNKGVDEYAVKRLRRDLNMLGHRRIVLRSDEESNIVALGTAVKREAEIDIVSEQTAVGDHQANGNIENVVRQIAGQFRTIKDGLETRINHKINGEMSIVPWMISHAAATINRTRKDDNGRTSHFKWKGREFNREVTELGECIMYLRLDSVGKDKFDSRWEEGVFLGVREESAEIIVGTPEGITKAKDFKRKASLKDRWNQEQVLAVKGTPWETMPGRGGNIEIRANIHIDEDNGPINVPPLTKEPGLPQRGRIYKDEVLRHGMTRDCQ